MTKILLILHVLAAAIAIGPVTAAGSVFPAIPGQCRRLHVQVARRRGGWPF
jgi:hypothetical protein